MGFGKIRFGHEESRRKGLQNLVDNRGRGEVRIEHQVIGGVEKKNCSRCARWKPLEDFHVQSSAWDGRMSACKECLKK